MNFKSTIIKQTILSGCAELLDKYLASQTEALEKAARFWYRQYWQFIIVVTLCLTAILALAFSGIISETVTATLLGSIIGYAFGKSRGSNTRKDEN